MYAHDRLKSNREKQHEGNGNQPSLLTYQIVKINFFKLKNKHSFAILFYDRINIAN